MPDTDFTLMTEYAKTFSGLTPEHEALLPKLAESAKPHLEDITNTFYSTLQTIDKAKPFLEGRLDALKSTHLNWLDRFFCGPYDEEYTAWLYKIGDVHVQVGLPVEFMAGGMALIGNALLQTLADICGSDQEQYVEATSAVTAMMGFSLIVMQESYQESTLAAELTRFLEITGMSRKLFDNLATAYRS